MFLIGNPQAAHHVGYADIQRRDPPDDLLVILRLPENLTSSCRDRCPRQGHNWRARDTVLGEAPGGDCIHG